MPVALVTGGAQGLGAAVCRQLATRGWQVAVADVNRAGAEEVAGACGAAAFALAVDLASADGPAWMVEETVRRAGRLDVLVNCAAVAPAEGFLEMTAAAWEQALLVNVRAAALAMAAAAGGACKSLKTTPLMDTAEGLEAMRKAASSGYRAPASTRTTTA
jgi:NAD(P)-dependent dehydrogenase (short-subunit alcohol dehydrogenase family)